MKSQLVGELLTTITNEGYKISCMFSIHMTLAMAEELFEVYRGIVLDLLLFIYDLLLVIYYYLIFVILQ